jgi:RHS repeat-associated protein
VTGLLKERCTGESPYAPEDALGSVRMVTDSTGAVVMRLETDVWGGELSVTDNVPGGMPYRFVGALGVRWDPDTKLYYARARWYAPDLQRWISRDPLRSMNGYRYGRNRPTDYVDFDGRQSVWIQYTPVSYSGYCHINVWVQSDDGLAWTKFAGNPTHTPGPLDASDVINGLFDYGKVIASEDTYGAHSIRFAELQAAGPWIRVKGRCSKNYLAAFEKAMAGIVRDHYDYNPRVRMLEGVIVPTGPQDAITSNSVANTLLRDSSLELPEIPCPTPGSQTLLHY